MSKNVWYAVYYGDGSPHKLYGHSADFDIARNWCDKLIDIGYAARIETVTVDPGGPSLVVGLRLVVNNSAKTKTKILDPKALS